MSNEIPQSPPQSFFEASHTEALPSLHSNSLELPSRVTKEDLENPDFINKQLFLVSQLESAEEAMLLVMPNLIDLEVFVSNVNIILASIPNPSDTVAKLRRNFNQLLKDLKKKEELSESCFMQEKFMQTVPYSITYSGDERLSYEIKTAEPAKIADILNLKRFGGAKKITDADQVVTALQFTITYKLGERRLIIDRIDQAKQPAIIEEQKKPAPPKKQLASDFISPGNLVGSEIYVNERNPQLILITAPDSLPLCVNKKFGCEFRDPLIPSLADISLAERYGLTATTYLPIRSTEFIGEPNVVAEQVYRPIEVRLAKKCRICVGKREEGAGYTQVLDSTNPVITTIIYDYTAITPSIFADILFVPKRFDPKTGIITDLYDYFVISHGDHEPIELPLDYKLQEEEVPPNSLRVTDPQKSEQKYFTLTFTEDEVRTPESKVVSPGNTTENKLVEPVEPEVLERRKRLVDRAEVSYGGGIILRFKPESKNTNSPSSPDSLVPLDEKKGFFLEIQDYGQGAMGTVFIGKEIVVKVPNKDDVPAEGLLDPHEGMMREQEFLFEAAQICRDKGLYNIFLNFQILEFSEVGYRVVFKIDHEEPISITSRISELFSKSNRDAEPENETLYFSSGIVFERFAKNGEDALSVDAGQDAVVVVQQLYNILKSLTYIQIETGVMNVDLRVDSVALSRGGELKVIDWNGLGVVSKKNILTQLSSLARIFQLKLGITSIPELKNLSLKPVILDTVEGKIVFNLLAMLLHERFDLLIDLESVVDSDDPEMLLKQLEAIRINDYQQHYKN